MKPILKIVKWALISAVSVYLVLIIVASLPYETVSVQELTGGADKFISVDGLSIHYTRQGSGPPLIFVHGFAGSTYTWRSLIPLLTGHFSVYALDLPGFGLSDKPSRANYDMASQGKIVLGFMDALTISSATLIGHSMGGVIVTCAALAAPARVDTLILVEPGFYTKGTPAILNYIFFPLDRIMAKQFYSREFRKKFLVNSFYDKSLVTDEVLDAYLRPTRTPGAREALAHMMTSVGARVYVGLTDRISRPTLVLWGQRGTGTMSAEAQRVTKEIAGVKVVGVKESGHYIQEEKPRELARAVTDFLAGVPSPK